MKDYNKNIRTKIAEYYVAFETNMKKKHRLQHRKIKQN